MGPIHPDFHWIGYQPRLFDLYGSDVSVRLQDRLPVLPVMKRVLLLLLVFLLLSTPVYASDGEEEESGLIWRIIDAIGGFFKNIIDAIGSFLQAIVNALWEVIKWLADAIKALFIPHEDYFPKAFARLQTKLNEKFGGVLGAGGYLRDRFASIQPYDGLEDSLMLEFPEEHLLGGISISLLNGGSSLFSMLRGAFSGLLVIMTFAFCYKHLIAQINT